MRNNMKSKNIWRSSIIGLSLAIFSIAAFASSKPMTMGTGGLGGSYYPMGGDVVDFCSGDVSRTMQVVEQSNGSVGNIMDITNKKLHMGITQIDVLKYYAKVMGNKVNDNRIKVISGLHMEYGHLLIPSGWSPETSGFDGFLSSIGIGGSDNKGVSIDLLKGQKIGSWGGSLVSAKALSSFLELGASVVEIKSGQMVDFPILVISGQPSAVVEGYLSKGYQLIPIDASTLKTRAQFYETVSLSYATNGKVTTVPSFGVRAVLVGKASRAESRNLPLSELATCIRDSLIDLADDADTNPNWSSVYEFENDDNQIDWNYFDLL
jgi:hypothetical protein